ncbi:MAG: tetratricopeptide repeat protein [Paludibacter sp.]|nr:tetratricopeptide repeat protein [Paludibacter sp.]
MMYMKINGLLLIMLFGVGNLIAQEESSNVREGNKLYKSEKYVDAEVAYRKGLQKNPKSFEANYNLGNALFKQGKNSEAFEQFKNAAALQSDNKEKMAAVFHNAGNALLAEKKYDESINAYKMALKMNPKDDETRYNLAYAQMMLKKQQQNKDKKDDKKDQEKEKEKQQQQQQPQPQPQQPKMSKQNAQQILDALMQDEKNTMEKTKKQPVRAKKSAEKDW